MAAIATSPTSIRELAQQFDELPIEAQAMTARDAFRPGNHNVDKELVSKYIYIFTHT